MKVCNKCGETKPLDMFSVKTKNGRPRGQCKECVQKASIEYRQKNKAKLRITEFNRRVTKREYTKQWFEKNADKRKEYETARKLKEKALPPSTRIYIKTCQITGKIYIAKANTGKYSPEGSLINARNRAIATWKQYRKQRPSRPCKNCGKEYQPVIGSGSRTYCSDECIKDVKRATKAKRARGIEGGIITRKIRLAVYQRHNYHCAMCNVYTGDTIPGLHLDTEPTIDHIIPVSKGGTNHVDNLQLLCRRCNCIVKGDRTGGIKSLEMYNPRKHRRPDFSARNV